MFSHKGLIWRDLLEKNLVSMGVFVVGATADINFHLAYEATVLLEKKSIEHSR